MNRTTMLPIWLALLLTAYAGAAESKRAGDDVKAVKKYLAEHCQAKNWEQGPSRLQNAAIDRAFPDSRFYYVFSSQLPAPRIDWISVMMRVRDDGSVAEVSGSGAANDGLMRVANAGDAKIAAAAIMSLAFGPSGPVSISSDDVRVAPMNGGWLCLATPGPAGGKDGRQVVFDADGRCTGAASWSPGG
jgi:hypothetical protein